MQPFLLLPSYIWKNILPGFTIGDYKNKPADFAEWRRFLESYLRTSVKSAGNLNQNRYGIS